MLNDEFSGVSEEFIEYATREVRILTWELAYNIGDEIQ
jgi:hypothetical protein